MKGQPPVYGGLMVAAVALAFWGGYWAAGGYSGYRTGDDDFQNGSRKRSEGNSGEDGSRKFTAARSWPDLKKRVLDDWESSPAAIVDFELRDETVRLLEKLPVADLEKWLRKLVPDRDKDDDKNLPLLLREMILKVLAQRCGSTFVRSLANTPLEEDWGSVPEAMASWTKSDPAAVCAWLDGDDLPQEVVEELEDYREDALKELAGKDPEEFERYLASVDPEVRTSVLEDYAFRFGTIENRPEILERAARSPRDEAMALWSGLIFREAIGDLKRADATLKEVDVSAADRAILDEGVVSRLMVGIRKDNSPVMQWWVDRNSGQPAPKCLLDSLNSWSKSQSAEASIWVAAQPPGPQYDAFARILIEQRVGEHQESYPEVAAMAARISDPIIRTNAQLELKKSWQARDATAATEWEKGLPAADRERLHMVQP